MPYLINSVLLLSLNLMGYHLFNDTAEKEVFKNEYLKLTQAAYFARFNEQHLKNYFLHEG